MKHAVDQMLDKMDKDYPDLRVHCRAYAKTKRSGAKCLFSSRFVYANVVSYMQNNCTVYPNQVWRRYGAMLASDLCALSNWRYAHGIYHFNETLYNELIAQPLEILPVILLYKLPESSLFIETPENEYTKTGFFAHLDEKDDGLFLRLTYVGNSVFELPLQAGQSIQKIVADKLAALHIHAGIAERRHFEIRCRMSLNLLLYLCSKDADYGGGKKPTWSEQWQERKASHHYKIGYHIGQEIRNTYLVARASKKMKPHIRKAHWHTYWVGKRGEQEPILHWIAPVFVNSKLEQ